MTSTPVVLLLKRSGQSADRPSGSAVQGGELALSFGASDPGLYFEDSAGALRKIGPNHYATTAPNTGNVGIAGNSVGETWVDSSTASYYLKVWTGSTWQKIGAAFADTATSASSASTAQSAVMSSGTISASGAILSSGTIAAATVVLSGLPDPTTKPSGTLYYQVQTSGAFPLGLYVRATNTWLLT
jgi:hypothetical protein